MSPEEKLITQDHEDFPVNIPDRSFEAPNNERIEKLESRLLKLAQIDCPLVHRFAPGVYLREIFMPAGAFIIGQEHITEHFNIVLKGRASVLIGDQVKEIKAPDTFVSKPGIRKVLFIHEDMIWQTVHPTHETDMEKLRAELIVQSDSFKAHEIEEAQERLKLAISSQTTQEKAPAT